MVDHVEVEPDFYVDKGNDAVYIPDAEGAEKSTMLYNYDVFDFNLEVEPILQVLIGKTLEQSRVEVIEDYENE